MSTITGQTWSDRNNNRIKDAGEEILSGVRVYLDFNNNQVLDANEPNVTTDATGKYEFTNLLTGIYTVRFITPSGTSPIFPNQNTPSIPFQALEANNQGIAAWSSDGTGPEPAQVGHSLTSVGIPNGFAYYYLASRDYVDASANAGIQATGAIAGFPNFTTALANHGYSISDLTVKFGLASLGEDIEGQDWFIVQDTETRYYTGGNITFQLRGEDLIGSSFPGITLQTDYNEPLNSDDDKISGWTGSFIPENQSANSSTAVQEVAQALLTDISNQGIRFIFSSLESATQTEFISNGRIGGFFETQLGQIELASDFSIKDGDYTVILNPNQTIENLNFGFSTINNSDIFISLDNGEIGRVNELTGIFTKIPDDLINGNPHFLDIAYDGFSLWGQTDDSYLYQINVDTGERRRVGFVGVLINSLAFDGQGNLYGVGNNDLYQVDTNTGQATLKAELQNINSSGDIAWNGTGFYITSTNPVADTLYFITTDGNVTQIGSIGFQTIFGLAYYDDQLFGYTSDGKRIQINTVTGVGSNPITITGYNNGFISGADSLFSSQTSVISFNSSNYSVNENGQVISEVTLNRVGNTNGNVSVTVNFSNWTATAPSDYDNTPIIVTFASGETSKNVTIPIVNDNVFEPDETIYLTLTNPTNGANLGTQKTAILTIINDDVATGSGTLAFSSPQFSVLEDGTPIAAVTVTRSGGRNGVIGATINLTNGTAKAPNDYNNTPITVNFADGETSKTVSISIINDATPELNETLQLILTNPTGGANIGEQSTATLSILDQNGLLITGLPQGSLGSNKGETTIVISGKNFSPQDQISLIADNGTETTANKVYWVNEAEAWATFNLRGLNIGKYDIQVKNGQNSYVANNAFTVTNGAIANLQFQISYPAIGVATVTYTNVGQTDLIAPLLRIIPTNAQINYSTENTISATLRQLLNFSLGTSENGPGGILTPGESGQFSFSYTPNGNGLISFAVERVAPDDIINWESIKAASRPNYNFISDAAWEAIWSNLTNSLGTTAAEFQTVMAENANYLSQLGQENSDLNRLFEFEWKQAANTLTNVSLTSVTDIVDTAPGLSLTFNRTFYQSIAERYNLGSLGRGWVSQWDLRATTNSQGNVVIRSVGDLQRVFEQQTGDTYTENSGATIRIINSEYRLQEANGIVSLFGSDGKLIYVEDPNGNRITLEYTNNLLTKLVHTNGDRLTLDYNTQGRISQITDSTGQVSTYNYDPSGETLLSVTTPGGTTTYTYDNSNIAAKKYSLLSVTSELGYQRTFEYDNQGRLTKEYSNGQTQTLTYSYDRVGGVTITDSTQTSQTILLDDRGNAGQIRGINNQNLLFSYDADGNLINATLPNGGQTAYNYDNLGNLTNQKNLLSQNVEFTYNTTINQLTSFTDPKGNSVNYTYDTKGNLTQITYADGSNQKFTVDALGNITTSVNRRGNTIQYTYNNNGLLTQKQYADGSSITYSYDSKGNLASITDANGTITMQYDTANQLTQINYPNSRSLQYTYNADGQRTQLVSSNGYTVNYSYDAVGRLTSLTNATGASIISYEYDNAGRLIKETNGNGTYTTYEYDQQSQLIGLINYKADNTVNSLFKYSYDNLGRRTSMATLEGIFQYGYDATGQLVSVVTPDNRTINYQYDAAGNRIAVIDNNTTTNYTSNNLNQYTNVGNTVYAYDADGNLISKTQGGQTSTYSYDVENRLVKVETPQGTWEYEYDGLGNRVATIFNGERTEYLLDPFGLGDVIGEYDSNGNLIANYTHGIGLVSRLNGSNINYYDADALGSTVGLTANDGSYVNRYSYLPFGEDLTKIEGIANPFEYVGQWGVMDEANGLDFMRARFYDPQLGRFTAIDPIGLNSGDTNFYRYVGNAPNIFIDPSGLILKKITEFAVSPLVSNLFDSKVDLSNDERERILEAGFAGSLELGILAFGLGASLPVILASAVIGTVVGINVQVFLESKGYGGRIDKFLEIDNLKYKLGDLLSKFLSPQANDLLNKILPPPNPLFYSEFNPYPSQFYNGSNGGSWNDPHLETLDGLGYDFQAVGEFTLLKSTTDNFEIQTRQQPWENADSVSINTAVAIKLDDQRIAIYANQAQPLLINGLAVTLPDDALYAVGQNLITRDGNQYTVITANNDLIQISDRGTFLNINLGLADNRRGKVVGLLGNYNNNSNDEFALRDGTVIGGFISNQQLYGEYANSWRITQETSLFDYAAGENTNTFTNFTFPQNIITAATLTPEQRAAAEKIARDAGITDPDILEDVILDIFITNGDPKFIQAAITQQRLEVISKPNTLINPEGFGTQYWLAASEIIPYTIRFSNNAAEGTTPIAQVTITQQLDSDLDLNTFTLNDFGFGDITIDVPLGTQNYSQRLDLRSTRGVFVDVNAELNASTGVVTWTFTAIDPTTGNAANIATQGFLPPNDQNGVGAGFVGYSVQPQANPANNTRIDAQASITFNNQTPILTTAVFNTLDSDIPTSKVNALPVNSNSNISVSWTGADNGSGIAAYDIYVAANGGEFVLWKDDTTETSAIYNGQVGSTYAFYSVATDNIGFTEAAPNQADATTTVDTLANDSDLDGIGDEIELLAGDNNQDGIPDAQQANVVSLFRDNSNTNNLDEIITIVSKPGTTLNNVNITANPAVNQPNDPEQQGIVFPANFVNFNLQGLTAGTATNVNLLLPNVSNDQAYNTYWKYGKTPENNQDHWYEFIYDGETGAEFIDRNGDGNADQIVLHFVDGKRGDSDLTANGIISGNGAPGVTKNPPTLTKTNQNIWELQGNTGVAFLNFSLTSKNTNLLNEVGIFKVDQQNRVNGIAPGEAGFAKAALEQGEVIFSALADNLLAGVNLTRKLQFGAGERLAFYFIPNGTTDGSLAKNNFNQVFFSIDQANPNGANYLQASQVNGGFNLGWEQGDNQSFDDLVMRLQLDNNSLSQQNLIASYQGEPEGELINLESFVGRNVNVSFTVNREAAYNNFVGFYKVEDIQGTITDPLTGNKLKPGDAGYTQLVLQLRESEVELSAANLTTVSFEDTLRGGYIYAPFIIADGNPMTLQGDLSKVYFPFIQGNADKVDHIRLLGDNIFGFEDLPGGGDNDFNDVIIQAKFTF